MIEHFYFSYFLWSDRSLTITNSYTSTTGFDILQDKIIFTYIFNVKTGFFLCSIFQMAKINLRHGNDCIGFYFTFRIFYPLASYYLDIRFTHTTTIYWISYKYYLIFIIY